MYHPVYSSTSWTDTDPIYTEMSPLLKTLGHHTNFNNSQSIPVGAAQITLMHISFYGVYVGNIPVAVVKTRKHDASAIYLSVVTQYSQQFLVTMRY